MNYTKPPLNASKWRCAPNWPIITPIITAISFAYATDSNELTGRNRCRTQQIGTSFREGGQVRNLAGIDAMTISP